MPFTLGVDNFLYCGLNDKKYADIPFSNDEKDAIDLINHQAVFYKDLDSLAEFLFKYGQIIMPCEIFAIAFIEENGRRITLTKVISDLKESRIEEGTMYDMKRTVLMKIIEWKYPLIIGDMREFAKDYPDHILANQFVDAGMVSSMICPLFVDDKPLGFIFRGSSIPNLYNLRSIRISYLLLESIAQVLEKIYIINQLKLAINSYMEMLGFVSHELKSPLDSIITLGKTLTNGFFGNMDQRHVEYVNRITKKAEYLRDLSSEYLTLSRFETGKMSLNIIKINFIKEIVEESLDMVSPQLDKDSITIIKEFQDDIPNIECDITLMKIVTGNLLNNAIKYNNKNGEIKVTVRMYKDRLIFSVWNTGPGFSAEEKNKLFRKFSRLEKDELKKRKGSGIGLYSCWKIMQLHNGRIWGESEEGKWAEFAFLLPAEHLLDKKIK